MLFPFNSHLYYIYYYCWVFSMIRQHFLKIEYFPYSVQLSYYDLIYMCSKVQGQLLSKGIDSLGTCWAWSLFVLGRFGLLVAAASYGLSSLRKGS